MSKNSIGNPVEILRNQMTANTNVTIRKLANATEISYGRLLKASRAPVAGQIYDPENVNYEAMALVLGVDKILDVSWDALNSETGGRSTLAKDIASFKLGDKVYLRKDNETPFEIIHITETHIVIQQLNSQTPIAWSIGTFLINGPVFEPRVKKAAEEAANA